MDGIGIPVPAGDDVHVEVAGYASTCTTALIYPKIEALRVDSRASSSCPSVASSIMPVRCSGRSEARSPPCSRGATSKWPFVQGKRLSNNTP